MQSVSREEVEQMNVAAEMMRQGREEWVRVEKIIASRESPTHIVRQLQRIRKRRRTFRLEEEDEETKEGEKEGNKVKEEMGEEMMVEEKQERVVIVKQETQTEDMRTEVEEESVTAVASTDLVITPHAPSSTPSVPPDASMVIDTGPDVFAAMKEEGEEAAKMEDDSAEADDVADVADAGQLGAAEEEAKADEQDEENDDEEELYNDGTTVTQYFVKWRCLAHEDCTWESAEDIAAYQAAIDDFLDLERLTAARPTGGQLSRKFRKLDVQPTYLQQGELREYQLEGLNWLIHNWCNDVNSSQRITTHPHPHPGTVRVQLSPPPSITPTHSV